MGLFTSLFACGQKAQVTMNQLINDETTTGTRVIVAEMTEAETAEPSAEGIHWPFDRLDGKLKI